MGNISTMLSNSPKLDFSLCEQARLTRDARFDGLFFIAVKSTGIYCRPVCPAPPARAHNVNYFPSAAAAAAVGFRPCLRCRPEAAPGSPLHRGTETLVTNALKLIEEGALDNATMSSLADRIGIGERHLRRLFVEQLGANPLQVNATRRVLFAKKLLSETTLPITDIALASGYGSLRRFNDAFRLAYGMPPRDIRRKQHQPESANGLTLRLPYRPPYDFAAQLAFFARRAIPGVEVVDANLFRRVFMQDGMIGNFTVTQINSENSLLLNVQFPKFTELLKIVTRVRCMFDLDADAYAINTQLAKDDLLRPLIEQHPGQRLPGAWNGFEIAVRAILGQQISVIAARTFAQRLVERFGTRLETPVDSGLYALFPTPNLLADANLTTIGLPRTRAATINALARAVCEGQLDFRLEQTLSKFIERCISLPGIGAWTAHYIAMRALSQPDAFPAADLVLRKAATNGKPLATKALEDLSQAWRPWRAYAVMHLWRSAS